MYDTTLRLPATFSKPPHLKTLSPTWIGWNPPCGTCQLCQPDITLARNSLFPSPVIFLTCVQRDTVKCSLQPPDNGSFPVLKNTSKHYTVKVNWQQQIVFIDRLKLAFLEDSDRPKLSPTPTPPSFTPTRTTHSGCTVCWPDRLTLTVISCPCWTLGRGGVLWWTHALFTYLVVELLFPVTHDFIISCMHDYSPPLAYSCTCVTWLPTIQYLSVPLLYSSLLHTYI